MKTRNCFLVLSFLLTLSLCTGQLFAQAERSDQAKPKRAEVKTDLGNPNQLARPNAAERLKAEQMKKKLTQPEAQPMKPNAQQKKPKQKTSEIQTVRGSKDNPSQLTPVEVEKLRQSQLQPSPANEGK